MGPYWNDPEWEDEVVLDCWLLCVCLCVCVCVFLAWGIQGENHTHLHCNGIFSRGTPSFIYLFIHSTNINEFLPCAKHYSRPPGHSDE